MKDKRWIHPVSAQIVAELKNGGKTVLEISRLLKAPYNLIYRHMKSLESAGFVQAAVEKRRMVYSLKDDIIPRAFLSFSEITKFHDALRKATPHVATAAKEVIETLEKKFPHLPMDVYFSGSFAKGLARRGSDVDAVVVVPEGHREEVEKEIEGILAAHAFVIERKTFEEKVKESGPHIKSVLAGIHIRLPL